MRLPLILALSLVANVALFAALASRPAAKPLERAPAVAAPSASTTAATATAATASAGAAKAMATGKAAAKADLWTKLESDDIRELIAHLRAAGFPPNVVRAVVQARLRGKYMSQLKEITAEYENVPYWQADIFSSGNSMKLFDRTSAIYREMSKEMRSLLGEDVFAYAADPGAAQKRQFGDIPKSKIDLVQRIAEDYNEMSQQIRTSTQGMMLPEDREKLALLEREKHADLAAVLTPDELADYEMRHSTITNRLRPALTLMDASEAEFRTIYQAMEPYREKLAANVATADAAEERTQAQQKANEAIKAALGDARYADYERASSQDFQQMNRLAQRNNLPPDAAKNAYAIMTATAAESVKIAQDTTRSREERREALKTLASNTKIQLTASTALGQAAGTGYADSARWLKQIENGMGVALTANGNFRTIPVAPTPRPKN